MVYYLVMVHMVPNLLMFYFPRGIYKNEKERKVLVIVDESWSAVYLGVYPR